MNIKSSENLKLYGMNIIFDEIIKLYYKKKLPNKILLSGKKGIGKSTFAYHIINCILSTNEDNKYDQTKLHINKENKSYKLIQNNSHPNFYLIDVSEEKKTIDISQIRKMINYSNKSSFNNNPRFVLIDNAENLNKNSTNALLKIVEEPNQNINFILIHNNEKNILPTLKSRCLLFKINFTFNECINIINSLLDDNIFDLMNNDLISYYNTPGDIINLINFAKEKKINLNEFSLKELLEYLINNSYYKKNKLVKSLLINFIELYFLKEYNKSSSKKSLLYIYHLFLDKIHNTEKFNLDEESLFLEFKMKLLNG
jgi:DNA polymerase III subunit delta'